MRNSNIYFSRIWDEKKYSTVSNCPVVWNKRYRVENSKK